MLERFKPGSIIAASPYCTEHIHVNVSSVRESTDIEIKRKGMKEAAYVRVNHIKHGTVYAKSLPEDEWLNKCPLDIPGNDFPEVDSSVSTEEFFKNEREESIEWEGTEQSTSGERVSSRSEVFNQGDIRGSKNDSLDGHL
jgi:hypothetical protein